MGMTLLRFIITLDISNIEYTSLPWFKPLRLSVAILLYTDDYNKGFVING